ncbi:MAG: hypothetical protein AB1656_17670 [Candidatus Omnitrophota bacterium]
MKKYSCFIALTTLALLAATGFGAWLFSSRYLSGYTLLLHVAASAIFSTALAIWIFLSAPDYHLIHINVIPLSIKILFWLIALLSLPLILSIAASLYPLASTAMQKTLIQCHRYSAALMTLAVVIFLFVNKQSFSSGEESSH